MLNDDDDDSKNIKPLNTKLNPICHLLALLDAHHILHVSRIRVKRNIYSPPPTLQYPMTISTELHSIVCLIITTQGRKWFLFVTEPDCSVCISETHYKLHLPSPRPNSSPPTKSGRAALTFSLWQYSQNCHKLSSVQILKEVCDLHESKINYQNHKFYINYSHTWEPQQPQMIYSHMNLRPSTKPCLSTRKSTNSLSQHKSCSGENTYNSVCQQTLYVHWW
jgi:hypothetical protein